MKLTIKSETLAELTTGELAAVAGAGRDIPTLDGCQADLPTLPLHWCFVTTPATPADA